MRRTKYKIEQNRFVTCDEQNIQYNKKVCHMRQTKYKIQQKKFVTVANLFYFE